MILLLYVSKICLALFVGDEEEYRGFLYPEWVSRDSIIINFSTYCKPSTIRSNSKSSSFENIKLSYNFGISVFSISVLHYKNNKQIIYKYKTNYIYIFICL